MTVVLLRFLLAPLLVGAASLAARRWGDTVGGWIAALLFVAGPLLLVMALEQGPAFAAASACTAISGIVALALFALVYAHVCRKLSWPVALATGWIAYLGCAASMRPFTFGVWPRLAGALAALVLARWLLPDSRQEPPRAARTTPAWNLPARMGSAALLVGTVATLARLMGPSWSGLLTPFPIATTILVAFSHAQDGPDAVARMLRGYMPALTGLAFFFAILALELGHQPLPLVFVAGGLATVVVQTAAIRLAGR